MAQDSSLFVRRAGIVLLKSAAPVSALVADRVYPPQRPAKPAWPFLAWGVEIVSPFDASCMAGSQFDFALHAYAETGGTGGATVSGEERARSIANLAAKALVDAQEIDLTDHGCPFPAKAYFTWLQTQAIQDTLEADAWHAIATMRAHIVS